MAGKVGNDCENEITSMTIAKVAIKEVQRESFVKDMMAFGIRCDFSRELTCASSATEPEISSVIDSNVIAVGGIIGIVTTDTIVDTTICAEAGITAVVGVRRVVGLEKAGNGVCLVA